jgi:hypothetical protein
VGWRTCKTVWRECWDHKALRACWPDARVSRTDAGYHVYDEPSINKELSIVEGVSSDNFSFPLVTGS